MKIAFFVISWKRRHSPNKIYKRMKEEKIVETIKFLVKISYRRVGIFLAIMYIFFTKNKMIFRLNIFLT